MEAEGDHEGSAATYTLDQGLTAIGFGKFKFGLLMYAGVGSFAEALEMMLLSYLGLAIQPEWGLSSNQVNLVSVLTFCGMLAGSYLWGIVSDTRGRKNGFLGAAILAVAAGFLSTLAPSYTIFLILRSIFGIGLGAGHVYTCWFMEFLATPNRGIWMVVFSGFASLGTISEALLSSWIMPRYGWRWLVGVSLVPHLVALLFYCYMPESPRYEFVQRRLKNAVTILENGAAMNKTNLPDGELIFESERTSSHSARGFTQDQTESGHINENASERTQAESRHINENASERTQAESRQTNENSRQRTQSDSAQMNENASEISQSDSRQMNRNASERIQPKSCELNQGVPGDLSISGVTNENAPEKTQLQSDELNQLTNEGGSSVPRPLDGEHVSDSDEIKEEEEEEDRSTTCPFEIKEMGRIHGQEQRMDIPHCTHVSGHTPDDPPPATTHDSQEPKVTIDQKRPLDGEHVSVSDEINEDASKDQSTEHDTSTEHITLSEHTSENAGHNPPPATNPDTPNILEVEHQIQVTDDTHLRLSNMVHEDVNVSTGRTPLLASTQNTTPDVQRSKLAMLVSPQWIITTILLWILYFFNVFSYFGIILLTLQVGIWSPLSLSKGVEHPNFYKVVLITALAELPGVILAATLTWSRVGRKRTMATLFCLGFVLILPLVVHLNTVLAMLLVFGVRMFISASFIVVQIYAEEVYPTIIRTTGVGVAKAIGGFGGMLWPFVGQWLSDLHLQTLVIILFAVKILLSFFLVVLLPFETSVRELE